LQDLDDKTAFVEIKWDYAFAHGSKEELNALEKERMELVDAMAARMKQALSESKATMSLGVVQWTVAELVKEYEFAVDTTDSEQEQKDLKGKFDTLKKATGMENLESPL
jgi:Ser/Thr protein kinase RdoA (MazF antagonist)